MPEFWLNEQTFQVIQVNHVTRVTYDFMSLEDAKKGKAIAEKVAKKCLGGRNKQPLYPDYIIQEIQKQGIWVRAF